MVGYDACVGFKPLRPREMAVASPLIRQNDFFAQVFLASVIGSVVGSVVGSWN